MISDPTSDLLDQNSHFNKVPRSFVCTSEFEEQCIGGPTRKFHEDRDFVCSLLWLVMPRTAPGTQEALKKYL